MSNGRNFSSFRSRNRKGRRVRLTKMSPCGESGSGYSENQIDCICDTLYYAKDGPRICRFLDFVGPRVYTNSKSYSVFRAVLYRALYSGQYNQVYELLQKKVFCQENFDELQEIWFKAHYAEVESRRQKPLGAVEKYRLRKKYPPPYTIWDGQETIYSFKENARKARPITVDWTIVQINTVTVQALKTCYRLNRYPSAEEKKGISSRTGLSFIQVSNWFKNRRQRDKTADASGGGSCDSPPSGSDLPSATIGGSCASHRRMTELDELASTLVVDVGGSGGGGYGGGYLMHPYQQQQLLNVAVDDEVLLQHQIVAPKMEVDLTEL